MSRPSERALADAEAAEVGLIAQAARGGNWTAAAWLLERRFRERWGRRERHERGEEAEEREERKERDQEIDTAEFDRQVEELVAAVRAEARERLDTEAE